MDSFIPIAIVALLIVLNGLFVAAEFALISAPRTSIERQANSGSRIAIRLRDILSNPIKQDRYIATAQLGITLASLGLGMYGEHMLALWLESRLAFLPFPTWMTSHTIASILSIAFLTYLHIVIGEMIPKSLALQQAEKTAMRVTPIMQGIQAMLYPFVVSLNGIGNYTLKLMGIRRSEHGNEMFHTSEELEFVIRESQEGGLLRKETGEVLQDLLDFGDLVAREVMIPRTKIVGIPIGASSDEIAQIIEQASHTRYPLYEGDRDHIIGSIHIKELLQMRISGESLTHAKARDVPFIPQSATLEQVLQTMQEQNSQMIVVMDEYGGTAGLITIEDIFEEVVGEFQEHEGATPSFHFDAEGHLHVDGLVRLEEVGDQLNMSLEHDEVDTVSGLVLTLLGRPPSAGDEVEFNGARFIVTAIDGHGVGSCLVIPPQRME